MGSGSVSGIGPVKKNLNAKRNGCKRGGVEGSPNQCRQPRAKAIDIHFVGAQKCDTDKTSLPLIGRLENEIKRAMKSNSHRLHID